MPSLMNIFQSDITVLLYPHSPMVEISANISCRLSIHDIRFLVVPEEFPSRFECFLNKEGAILII